MSQPAFDLVRTLLDSLDIGLPGQGVRMSRPKESIHELGGRRLSFALDGIMSSNVYDGTSLEKAIATALDVDVQTLLFAYDNLHRAGTDDYYWVVLGHISDANPADSWALAVEGLITEASDRKGGNMLEGVLLEHPDAIRAHIAEMRRKGISALLNEEDELCPAARQIAAIVGDDPQAMTELMDGFRAHPELGPAFRRWEAERGLVCLDANTPAPQPARIRTPKHGRL